MEPLTCSTIKSMQIDTKTSIPLIWVGAIVIAVAAWVGSYTATIYGTKSAIRELKHEMMMEVQSLRDEDRRLWDNFSSLKDEQKRQENLIVQFGEMLIPERTSVPTKQRFSRTR